MEHLLFAGYLVLFAWIVTRVRFFTHSGLTSSQLIIFFLLKVMAGILYGWIGVYYGNMAQMVDTWAYHYESVRETKLLIDQPGTIFKGLFQNDYESGYGAFFSSSDSWWNDLKANSFIKILALLNLASFNNYYINVVFYSFLSLFGPVALFRVMHHVYPGRRIAVMLATFLIPSFLYWTSGLHKEGLIFTGFALVIYHLYFGMLEPRFSWWRLVPLIAGLLLVLMLRNFLVVVLVPAALTWIIARKSRLTPWKVFAAAYLLFFAIFFTARYLHPRLDFPEAVVNKQQAFLRLHGGSSVAVTELEPTFTSFLVNTPEALVLSAIRPFPSDVRHLLSLAASTEINFLLLLFVVFLVLGIGSRRATPFILFCIFLSFSVMLMIGFSVNNLGAIVRYRSIVLPLLMVPVIANLDWTRISQLLFGNIESKNNI
ncbi:MAG TPA: hypothetical protein VFZ78_09130 [Flavisolibacter sp.]